VLEILLTSMWLCLIVSLVTCVLFVSPSFAVQIHYFDDPSGPEFLSLADTTICAVIETAAISCFEDAYSSILDAWYSPLDDRTAILTDDQLHFSGVNDPSLCLLGSSTVETAISPISYPLDGGSVDAVFFGETTTWVVGTLPYANFSLCPGSSPEDAHTFILGTCATDACFNFGEFSSCSYPDEFFAVPWSDTVPAETVRRISSSDTSTFVLLEAAANSADDGIIGYLATSGPSHGAFPQELFSAAYSTSEFASTIMTDPSVQILPVYRNLGPSLSIDYFSTYATECGTLGSYLGGLCPEITQGLYSHRFLDLQLVSSTRSGAGMGYALGMRSEPGLAYLLHFWTDGLTAGLPTFGSEPVLLNTLADPMDVPASVGYTYELNGLGTDAALLRDSVVCTAWQNDGGDADNFACMATMVSGPVFWGHAVDTSDHPPLPGLANWEDTSWLINEPTPFLWPTGDTSGVSLPVSVSASAGCFGGVVQDPSGEYWYRRWGACAEGRATTGFWASDTLLPPDFVPSYTTRSTITSYGFHIYSDGVDYARTSLTVTPGHSGRRTAEFEAGGLVTVELTSYDGTGAEVYLTDAGLDRLWHRLRIALNAADHCTPCTATQRTRTSSPPALARCCSVSLRVLEPVAETFLSPSSTMRLCPA
jgi:hypothetical protein